MRRIADHLQQIRIRVDTAAAVRIKVRAFALEHDQATFKDLQKVWRFHVLVDADVHDVLAQVAAILVGHLFALESCFGGALFARPQIQDIFDIRFGRAFAIRLGRLITHTEIGNVII